MNAAEEWRPVVGYESLYSVSNHGRVRSEEKTVHHKNGRACLMLARIRRPSASAKLGYPSLILTMNGKKKLAYVHSLVLSAFVSPRPVGCEACHRDGNPKNNRAENLRWGTRKENHADKKLHGTTSAGERHHGAKLTDQLVTALRARRMQGASFTTLSKEFDITRMTAYRAAVGQSWSHLK